MILRDIVNLSLWFNESCDFHRIAHSEQQVKIDKFPAICDLNEISELYKIIWADAEVRQSIRYYYDNSDRDDEREICVVQRTRRGAGFLERDGIRKLAKRGEAMLFIHGEDSRYGYAAESDGDYAFDFISFLGPNATQLLNLSRDRAGTVQHMPAGCESLRLMEEILRRFGGREFRDAMHESSMIYEFLMALLREATAFPAERDPLRFANEYLCSRFHFPITVDDIAHASGLSREHLSRTFKERYGISPGKRLRQLRLETAKQLLERTHAPIDAIASRCGYNDPDAFSRSFRNYFGRNPASMRKSPSGD
ncbi:helix-turn-helix transcriptional regulator [Rubellicoccus peritrichatus]|uniref:Helix-turn-helix transcriptional regulator n=1 Tax=Rubellicoccus peritrichatus TaxID=3080537 RepID=A0AAQ3LB13_9BACT|nr:helix-turn-helix transcriptional regulator [Puniceicoccus sp. CR14]WOO42146.1 helix-turn-helix transcriptional regulator [Puniceicoccus sp. CR14]